MNPMTPISRHRTPLCALVLVLFLGLPVSPGSAAAASLPTQETVALLPGPLLSVATLRLDDGETYLAALLAPPEPEEEENDDEGDETEDTVGEDDAKTEELRSLLLIDPRTGETTLVADGLPEASRRLAALSRPGASDILVIAGRDGPRVLELEPSGTLRTATRPTDLEGFRVQVPARADLGGGHDLLAAVRPGELALLEANGLRRAATLPLPKRAERKGWGVRITSPPIRPVGGEPAADGASCWAVGPEAHGARRLRTLVHCVGGPDTTEAAEPLETWALLPEKETVTEGVYLRHGGRPYLVVLTRDKLGLFVKQRLRVFPVEASRNRLGTAPTLAAETGCPLWRANTLGFADADGDGRDDLILVCEKGLVDQELRVEIYRYLGGGRFEERVRDAELDGEYGSWLFDRDWTGDGVVDLLAVHEGTIDLHPGTGGRRRPIDRRPSESAEVTPPNEVDKTVTVEVDAGVGDDAESEVSIRLGGPRILGAVDVVGDTRPELLVERRGGRGGMLVILTHR